MLRGPPLPPLKHATIGEALAAAAEASTPTRTPTSTSTPTPTGPAGLTFLDAREQSQHFSFSDLRLRARRAAAGLAGLGIRPGDRVALVLPTGVDFMDAFFGALLAGAIPVPLYPPVRLGRLDEFHARTARLLRSCGARLLLTDARAGRLLGQAAARARPELGVRTVSDLPRGGELEVPAAPGDLALIQFSSGTTVEPKPVALTHANVLANVAAIDAYIPEEGPLRQRGVSWLPLYHDMGLIGCLLLAVYHPGPLALLPPEAFLARPALWLRAIARTRATLTVAPNFAFGLCAKRIRDEELEGADLSCLRLVLNGAEPIAPAALRRFCDRFARFGFDPRALMPVYGLSEASLAVTFSPPGRGPRTMRRAERELASVGLPVAGVEVSIQAEDGRELPDGSVGSIRVRGPSVMRGYFQDADATAQAVRDGWLDTGDLGFVDGGELVVSGRAKDVVVLRGANHSPQEFEDALDGLPGARPGCAVAVGLVPDGADGEELALLVEVEREGALGEDAVRARIVERTGVRPHTVRLLSPGTLPRTSSGKLRRAEALRQLVENELRPPQKISLLRMAREAALSAAALARLRFSR
ncbi:MAG TPA: fatty acyl-AMP ligase [Myxococcales bacterium]|nr:fatty acyl-AMP ligase [Myxococcales bacterium]